MGVLPIAMAVGSGLASLKGARDAQGAADAARKEASRKLSNKSILRSLAVYFPGLVPTDWLGPKAQAKVAARQNPLGAQVVQNVQQLAENPGQVSTIQYERAQEQANALDNSLRLLAGSGMAQAGYGAGSGLAGALQLAGTMAGAQKRNEALRDLAWMQENLRRQDISTSSQLYGNMLNQVFGLQQSKAQALGGQPQAAPNPWQQLAPVLGQLANYFADRQQPNDPYEQFLNNPVTNHSTTQGSLTY